MIGRGTKSKKRAARTALVSFSAIFLDVTQSSLGGALRDIQKTAEKEPSTARTLERDCAKLSRGTLRDAYMPVDIHLIELNRGHICIFQGFFFSFPETLYFRLAPMHSQFTLQ